MNEISLQYDYDEIIVGTGPSALGYLVGIKASAQNKDIRRLIVSRDLVSGVDISEHPKLSRHGGVLVDKNIRIGSSACPGATCSHGGLSNAWGGVLAKLSLKKLSDIYGDTVSNNILGCYKMVLDEIRKDKKIINFPQKKGCISVIDGSMKYAWERGGLSIAPVIDRLVDELGIELKVGLTIENVNKTDDKHGWRLSGYNEDGFFTLSCQRLVLAAGLVANIKLVFDEGCEPYFRDHSPYQFISLSFNNKKNRVNIFTPIANISSVPGGFEAEYDLKKLSLNFFCRSYGKVIGTIAYRITRFLPLSFSQIWTENTVIDIDRDAVSKQENVFYDILQNSVRLVGRKCIPIMLIRTPPGEGFHYISPKFMPELRASKKYGDAVDDGSLVILGGAQMKTLPVQHPTFTFMAHAAWLGANRGYC